MSENWVLFGGTTAVRALILFVPLFSEHFEGWEWFNLQGTALKEAKEAASAIGTRVALLTFSPILFVTVVAESMKQCNGSVAQVSISFWGLVCVILCFISFKTPLRLLRGIWPPIIIALILTGIDVAGQIKFYKNLGSEVCSQHTQTEISNPNKEK